MKKLLISIVVLGVCAGVFIAAKVVKSRAYDWLFSNPQSTYLDEQNLLSPTTDLFFVIADHWEPGGGDKAVVAAEEWLTRFRKIADSHHDSFGRKLQYTWFFPIDNFDHKIAAQLSEIVGNGYGEIEVHWHHRHESAEKFEQDLKEGLDKFLNIGALSRSGDGSPRFAFIHGNWALDNSRDARHCGVDDEIRILSRNGAVMDMTFPAIGTRAQPKFRAGAYYVVDDSGPKSYATGVPAMAGQVGEGLLLLQGPLGIDFKDPLIMFEYGALDDAQGTGFSGMMKRPNSPAEYFQRHRPALWEKYGARIRGKENWVFVKLHAHGMQHREILLGGLLDAALSSLEEYTDEKGIRLHFVTAREMFNLIRSVEDAPNTNEFQYDYLLAPPPNVMLLTSTNVG